MTNPKLVPGFGQSRTSSDPPPGPTPEDPREPEPMRDPPIYPEHDDGEGEVRQAYWIEAPIRRRTPSFTMNRANS
jgi:hypothetical protein